MNVVIIAIGSRGDIAPYLGLGARLQAEGHAVTIATQQLFASMVSDAGLDFRLMPGDARDLLRSEEGQQWQKAGGGLRGIGNQIAVGRALAADVAAGVVAAADGAEVLLLQRGTLIHGYLAGQAFGIPAIALELFPGVPTADFPLPSMGNRSLGRVGNQAFFWLLRRLPTPLDGALKAFQRELGVRQRGYGAVRMEMLEDRSHLILHGFSPTIVPRPRDWRPGVEVTGYWWPLRPPGWEPDPKLVDFLAAGPPPVYIGFGSMGEGEGERLSAVAAGALRDAGVRGVIQAGWAGLEATGDDVLVIGDTPHDWLFPRMAAVVHHCGAGTTGAGLRAGVPAIPVPFLVDQPFWADRLVRLGVAPATIPFTELSADRLATAIRQAVTEPAYRQRAAAIGERVRAEDGAGYVVEALRRYA